MKKKISALLILALCCALLLSFAACKQSPKAPEPEDTNQTQTQKPADKEQADSAPEADPDSAPQAQSKPKPEQSKPEPKPEPEPEPAPAPEFEELTFDEFMEKAEGIWIMEEGIDWMGMEYRYEFAALSKEYFSTAVYPGGGDRPAKLNGYKQLGENEFQLDLLYEAGSFMGEELPEARAVLKVTLQGSGKATLAIDNGAAVPCIYGGTELEDAQMACAKHQKNG